ncbi:MAG: LuxR C-terminal-related transcriptional regulator [Dehalococcoidia bacterium]|nr:LuxR C-terminal-related transcriptional regulator [Dehalococcoidia bacterium]
MMRSAWPPQRIPAAIASADTSATELIVRPLPRCSESAVSGVYADARHAARGSIAPPRVEIVALEQGTDHEGIAIGLQLRRRAPDARIVLRTERGAPRFLAALPPEATAGWASLPKRLAGDGVTMERAVQSVASGLVVIDPAIVARPQPKREGLLAALTEHERKPPSLAAQGLSNAGIAQDLLLAEKSVENRLVAIDRKLELESSPADHNPRVRTVSPALQYSAFPHNPSAKKDL